MKINEIFYSLQGEGHWTGTPAVFVRFSGCNLRCPFCDTQHQSGREMTEDEIVAEVQKYPASWVILTGGEPSLFITASLIDKIHKQARKRVAVETNGTHPIAGFPDWVTCSPKDLYCDNAEPVLKSCDELKVVFDGREPSTYPKIYAHARFLQPCDTGDAEKNAQIAQKAVEFALKHPAWRLSLQAHKILKIQ